MITQEMLRFLFTYIGGNLVRNVTVSSRAKAGDIAGYIAGNGYLEVGIKGKLLGVHRVIFCYHHGYFPENEVDHIDGDKLNNKIENLREVSHSCNIRNVGNTKANTSGIRGVTWNKSSQKWQVGMKMFGKSYHLGCFGDFVEAVAHRVAQEQLCGWSDCNSSSPAFRYMRDYVTGI